LDCALIIQRIKDRQTVYDQDSVAFIASTADKLAGSLDSQAGCAVFDCSVDGSENVDEAMIQTQE
jgi:hypothetical protein